jgi:hypothetical protein
MEFFHLEDPDFLNYLEDYSKLDVARNTDFMKTFPELEWLYK